MGPSMGKLDPWSGVEPPDRASRGDAALNNDKQHRGRRQLWQGRRRQQNSDADAFTQSDTAEEATEKGK